MTQVGGNDAYKSWYGTIMDTWLGIYEQKFNNLSFILEERYGDIVDQETLRYDGCIGRLQQREADMALIAVNYPLIAPNIKSGPVAFSSKTVMVSTYDSQFESQKTDVMEFLKSFDATVWTSIFSILVLINLIITISHKMLSPKRSRKKLNIRMVRTACVAAALKQFTAIRVRNSRDSTRLLLFYIIILVYYTHLFLGAMINTEMVIEVSPETISTYNDVLERENCRPYWYKINSAHWEFMNADKDSSAGKIWQRAVHTGVDKCFIEGSDVGQMMELVKRMIARHGVTFLPQFFVESSVANICYYYAVMLGWSVNLWHRTDPSAPETLMTTLQSLNISRQTSETLYVIGRRALDHNLMQIMTRSSFGSPQMISKILGNTDVRDCMSNQIIYSEHGMSATNLLYYSNLWKALAAGWFIASLIFMRFLLRHRTYDYVRSIPV